MLDNFTDIKVGLKKGKVTVEVTPIEIPWDYTTLDAAQEVLDILNAAKDVANKEDEIAELKEQVNRYQRCEESYEQQIRDLRSDGHTAQRDKRIAEETAARAIRDLEILQKQLDKEMNRTREIFDELSEAGREAWTLAETSTHPTLTLFPPIGDSNKIGLVKAVRKHMELGLKEAKDLADEITLKGEAKFDGPARSTLQELAAEAEACGYRYTL